MPGFSRFYNIPQPTERRFSRADFIVILGLVAVVALLAGLALNAPQIIQGPEISLSPRYLPYYAAMSLGRMTAAYCISLVFTLIYGRMAAANNRTEKILMPLLDVLQSVPILSFLPVVLLSLNAIFQSRIAAELSSIILIFTSQVWNLTYAWYQSLKTQPKDLGEASNIYHFNGWMRFKTLELPFASISLIWNSVMSWAGGWFYLMAAETFTVGQRDFRLPGLGSYLLQAAGESNFKAIGLGVLVLVTIVVLLDQLVWRPLLAWSDRFKLAMVSNQEDEPTSWFYNLLRAAKLSEWLRVRFIIPIVNKVDTILIQKIPYRNKPSGDEKGISWSSGLLYLLVAVGLLFGVYLAVFQLVKLSMEEWRQIGLGLLATLLRVAVTLFLSLAWTIPAGIAIGTQPRLRAYLQPLVQIAASIPATALFPVILLFLINLPQGLNLAAVLLMLLGTQWYLLFNIIAGASAIPQDLKYTTEMLQINHFQRWRTLTLPALFPYLVTGAITATGGAWNASIVAEHITYGGQSAYVTGIGAVIAASTAVGNYDLLLASTLSLVLVVILMNRFIWRRLYHLAEERYRME